MTPERDEEWQALLDWLEEQQAGQVMADSETPKEK